MKWFGEVVFFVLMVLLISLGVQFFQFGMVGIEGLINDEPVNESVMEDLVYDKINLKREMYGLQRLERDSFMIDPVSRGHSEFMAETGEFRHSLTTLYGENIVMIPLGRDVVGCGTVWDEEDMANCMVKSWMNSPGHRDNILTSHYERTGIGVVCTGYLCYGTQNFR